MQTSAWTGILRRIPPDQHDSLVIVTTVGIEISIQDILRVEHDHLVIRGRLAGTTDSGRVFFLPYDQLHYLGFQQEVRVSQITALYGEVPTADQPQPASVPLNGGAPAAEPEPPSEAPATAPPLPPAPSPAAEPAKPGQLKIPRRSGLIERLRARALLGPNTRPPADP